MTGRFGVLAITLVACVAGCTRIDYDSPTIQGRVIDGRTSAPVGDALVFLKEHRGISARSDANGHFNLPAVLKTSLTIPWADMIYLGCCDRGTVVVQASAFKDLEYRVGAREPGEITVLLRLGGTDGPLATCPYARSFSPAVHHDISCHAWTTSRSTGHNSGFRRRFG